MHSEEEIIKQRERKKKILKASAGVIIGVFVLFVILVLVLSGIDGCMKNQRRAEIDSLTRWDYIYPDPDYDYNIFEDDAYMATDRQVWFSDGVMKTTIAEDDYISAEIKFMCGVIELIINGDYEEYNKIFTDAYIRSAGGDWRERFTMQQLFNIELEYVDVRESGNVLYSDIMLTYRIRNNNGTFRKDLDVNDGILPVVYSLVTDSAGVIKVAGVLTYVKYSTGLY